MTAGVLDLNIEQGATFKRTCTIKNAAGTAIDITGYVFSGQIRERVNSSTVLATFTFTILNQVSNTGKFTMEISDTDTAAIPVPQACPGERTDGEYFYDIEVVKSGGIKDRLMQGRAIVSPEVTR